MLKKELRTISSVQDGIVSDEASGRVRLVEYKPGNGRRYVVTVSDMSGLPNADVLEHAAKRISLVWCQNYRRGWLASQKPSDGVHYSYVQTQLNCSIFDAVVIAELVGYLLGRPVISVEEFIREKTGT